MQSRSEQRPEVDSPEVVKFKADARRRWRNFWSALRHIAVSPTGSRIVATFNICYAMMLAWIHTKWWTGLTALFDLGSGLYLFWMSSLLVQYRQSSIVVPLPMIEDELARARKAMAPEEMKNISKQVM